MTLPTDHPVSRDVPTLIHDSRAWVPAEDYDRLREALQVATTTVEEWEACHRRRHPDPQGFRRAAVEYGKEALGAR